MNLYEQPELRDLTGPTLRPGGLELTRRMVEQARWRAGYRVLDLGCGPGESLSFLRGLGIKAVGLDRSATLLPEASAKGPVVRADALRLPFPDSSFQGVLAECVLSLMPDKKAVLSEIRRVLRQGEKLCLSDLYLREASGGGSVPGNENPGNPTGEPPQAENRRYASCLAGAEPLPRLVALMEESGFKILHIADETRSLKELAVKMIFRYGSTQGFFKQWEGAINCSAGSGVNAKIGYAVILARTL